MDLKLVIAELRAELESIDNVTGALEKLAELRGRRGTPLTASEAEVERPARRTRTRKPSSPRESAAAAASE
jgi:hypothetical protein